MDFTAMTDEEVNALFLEVQTEREDRLMAVYLPQQIEEMSARYKRITGRSTPPVEAAQRGVGRPIE